MVILSIFLGMGAIILAVLLYFLGPWPELRIRIRYYTLLKKSDIEGLSRYVCEAKLEASHPIAEDMKESKGYVLATFHPSEELELRQAMYLFAIVSIAKLRFRPIVLVNDDLLIYRNRALGIMDPEVSKAQTDKYRGKLHKFFRERGLYVDIKCQSELMKRKSRKWFEQYMRLGSSLDTLALEALISEEKMAEYDKISPFLRQSALMGAAFVSLLRNSGCQPLVVLCWEKRKPLWSRLMSEGTVDDKGIRFIYLPTLSDNNYNEMICRYVVSKDNVIECKASEDVSQRVQEYTMRWNERYDP